MKIASIDIGSNSVLLLIAEINNRSTPLVPLINEYRTPRISKGINKSKRIGEDEISKLYGVIKEYKNIINKYNCSKIIAIATNAIRIADNSQVIIENIKEKFGIDITVISGEDEARLSFLGALSSFKDNSDKLLIDIGGGSTEIVFGNFNSIIFKKSFPVGVVSITEKYFKHNPPLQNEIDSAKNYIESIFEELSNQQFLNAKVIAVAGTPTTLTCIKQKLTDYDENKVERSFLSKGDLNTFIREFSCSTYDEIKNKFGSIIYGREDIILAGTMILETLLSILDKENVTVSGRGLRYGAIIDFINKS